MAITLKFPFWRHEKKRTEARALMVDGIDPAKDRNPKKKLSKDTAANNFEKIAREWHTNRVDAWSPATAKDTINRLENAIFPEIGK